MLDVGGVASRTKSGGSGLDPLLLGMLDEIPFNVLNVIPQDIELLRRYTPKNVMLVSSNLLESGLAVQKYVDVAVGNQTVRIHALYAGENRAYKDVTKISESDFFLSSNYVNILMLYDDRGVLKDFSALFSLFDFVIVNSDLAEYCTNGGNVFSASKKGKKMVCIDIDTMPLQNEKSVFSVEIDDSIVYNRKIIDMYDEYIKEHSGMERESQKYLQMSPEEFIRQYERR